MQHMCVCVCVCSMRWKPEQLCHLFAPLVAPRHLAFASGSYPARLVLGFSRPITPATLSSTANPSRIEIMTSKYEHRACFCWCCRCLLVRFCFPLMNATHTTHIQTYSIICRFTSVIFVRSRHTRAKKAPAIHCSKWLTARKKCAGHEFLSLTRDK